MRVLSIPPFRLQSERGNWFNKGSNMMGHVNISPASVDQCYLRIIICVTRGKSKGKGGWIFVCTRYSISLHSSTFSRVECCLCPVQSYRGTNRGRKKVDWAVRLRAGAFFVSEWSVSIIRLYGSLLTFRRHVTSLWFATFSEVAIEPEWVGCTQGRYASFHSCSKP